MMAQVYHNRALCFLAKFGITLAGSFKNFEIAMTIWSLLKFNLIHLLWQV